MDWELVGLYGLILSVVGLTFTFGWWVRELRQNRKWERASLYREFASLLPALNDDYADKEDVNRIVKLRNEIRVVGSPETYEAVERVLRMSGASGAPGRGGEDVGEVLDAMRRDVGIRKKIDSPFTLVSSTHKRTKG